MSFKLPSIPVFFIAFLAYLRMSQAADSCEYKTDDRWEYRTKWCPGICCSSPREQRRENTTCCVGPEVYASVTTTPIVIFGYPLWALIICAICLCTAGSIFIHYFKRLHLFKHSQHFNSTVDASAAFTISKSTLNLQLNNDLYSLEANPPSYTSSTCPSPPPYTSIKTLQ